MDKHNTENDSVQSKEQEVSFDFSKVKRFFSSKKKTAILFTTILILIPVILTFYIRLQPQYLSQADNWAQSSVNNYFRNQIVASVNQQYPNLPAANKDALVNQQFAEFSMNNKEQLDQQVKATADYFKKGFRYEENNVSYTFLGDLDSYFFLRQARNLESKGTVCDEYRDGLCWDNHMYAPIGTAITSTMHPFGIFYLYKFLRIFNPAMTLMHSAFILPTLLAAIAAIAAFFVGKRIMNETAGFVAAMFITLSPMFLTRTLGSDTDIWNAIFPIIILWVFIEAFESKALIKKMALAVLAALLMGLFSFAWTGWWYIFHLINATLIGYIVFLLIRAGVHRKSGHKFFSDEIKHALIIFAIIFVGSAIFVSAFSHVDNFKYSFTEPVSRFLSAKVAANPSLWPNVLTTVAEMNSAGLDTIVAQTSFGIKIFFSLALLGIILSLVRKDPSMKEYILIIASFFVFLFLISSSALVLNPFIYLAILAIPLIVAVILLIKDKELHVDVKMAILLTIWFMGAIIASTKGVRFILLAVPVFAVGIGVAAGYLDQLITKWLKKETKMNEFALKVIVFVVLAFIVFMPFSSRMPYQIGISAGKSFIPSMTKGWWDGLTQIREQSQPNAIINSWWDFGHWFKYVADRAVTLDGASQNHPNAHWLGRILQTDNEAEAVGILRMLDCGSNNAFEEVNKKYNDTEIAQNIVRELILLDKAGAEKMLSANSFSDSEIKTIMNYSHCDPPEDYFITSEDMVGKAGVWAHFGQWDFDKAFIINNLRSKSFEEATSTMKARWNYTDEQASSIYYSVQALQSDSEINNWISPWPNYFTQNLASCQQVLQNTTVTTITNASTNESSTSTTTNVQALVCGIGRTINQDANGITSVDGAYIDFNDLKNSSLIVGSYDTAGNRRGSGRAVPSSVLLLKNNSIERIRMDNTTFNFDVLVDIENNNILVSDPLLSESMFTKLFFFEGRYTSHFEKFYDAVDITGTRIIIWKVKW